LSSDTRTNQVADWVQRENLEGSRLDPGPYIGIVKENRDPLYAGRLQIWIAEFGGPENDPKYWRTVSYAGPFMGSTVQEPYSEEAPTASSSDKNSFRTVRHTYGMWFNVPDLENWVLCTFVAGDPARGYWFACVPNQIGHHMIPAIGSSTNIASPDDALLKRIIKTGEPYPVAEFNESSKSVNWADVQANPKPVHENQLKILLEQGLDRYSLTKSRGIIKSSSQRGESPSGVFGFSTPGRPLGAYPPARGTTQQRKVKTRVGGHTFVMDDGDEQGQNNLTRWRSAGGHQILMDDTEKVFYISNSTGTTWIEMNAAGHLNIYSSNSINLRTKAEINFHADSNMNINVGGSFNLNVKGAINIQGQSITARGNKAMTLFGGSLKLGSEGRLDLYTSGGGSFTAKTGLMMTGKTIGLNSGSGPAVGKPRDLPLKSSADTKKDSNGQWQLEENKIKSVATMVPTHEPWNRKAGVASAASNAVQDTSNDGVELESQTAPDEITDSLVGATDTTVNESISNVTDGLTQEENPGIYQAAEEQLPIDDRAVEAAMYEADAPAVTETVGPLSSLETKALMVATKQNLTDGLYSEITGQGAVGAYAFNADHLVESGHLSRASIEQYIKNPNNAMKDLASWTGKNGIKSLDELLGNKSVQDAIMIDNLRANFNRALSNGGILNSDTNAVVGGILSVAHSTSAAEATVWRRQGIELANSYGSSAAKLFNIGADAVKRLGKGP